MSGYATLGDFATSELGAAELWRVEAVAGELKFDPGLKVSSASGGERRRAALAKLIAEEPDIILLDEPTNHLDIEAIRWLEGHLATTRSAFIVISHDRAFLKALTKGTFWIDRGVVRRQNRGFADFEAWRDKTWADEDDARHKLDRRIKAEARWAVEGISARRKRNQGRLRALNAMRAERRDQIKREGTASLALASGTASGKKVIEAVALKKAFGEKIIAKGFSLRVLRGERVAFVGPNGVGKTTLIEMLIGQMAPDEGQVTLGTGVELAVFDQRRAALDPNATLWESLTGDPAMRISGRADQVMVRGTPRHVVGYLTDFLFDEAQARAPVRSLSGGEKARLLLARIMAQSSNLLVLDEPTNDLDIETLDLLQDVLGDYDGTVLLVSHDRDFMDRVATSTVALEGEGKITIHVGGWSDFISKAQNTEAEKAGKPGQPNERKEKPKNSKEKRGLSFTERHRLEELPSEIGRLETEIGKLESLLADPELYAREPAKFMKATEALSDRQSKLAAFEDEWLLLEEKADHSEG